MKKDTKSLWIYAAVLLTIAIALIVITTLSQAQLVEHNGNFEVFGTLMQTSEENIARLTNENIELSNKNVTLSDENAVLIAENAELKDEVTAQEANASAVDQTRVLSANILSAYIAEDTELLTTLLSSTTQESLDAFLPGLYTLANDLISE